MFQLPTPVFLFLSVLGSAYASPVLLQGRTTPVSTSTIEADYVRPALLSRVAYCPSASVVAGTCGTPCDALNGGVVFLQTGGDDAQTPLYYIAHDTTTDTLVVAHDGTNTDNFISILNDAEFALKPINTTSFPTAAGQGIELHDGFQETFERTIGAVSAGLNSALASTGATKVLFTGHSLGGAISTLGAVYFKTRLASSVQITTTVFAIPRIGNSEWADFADSTLGTLTRITNMKDPVPILPPQLFGYRQVSGEVHINSHDANGEATSVVACTGQEDSACADSTNLLTSDADDHLGPYFHNITFGHSQCAS